MIDRAATPSPLAQVGAALSREELTKILLDLVSERTGYPTDMLGLDQDLEADLGHRFYQARGNRGRFAEPVAASIFSIN